MGGTNDRYFWTVAVGAALIIVGTLYGAGGPRRTPDPPGAAARPAPLTEVARPSDGTPPASSVRPGFIASVYECRRGGERVFSDERCGSDARVRSIRDPSHMDAQDTTILSVPVSWTVRPQAPDARPALDNRSACASIESQQQALNARMREGYAAAEGELLRARLRGLAEEYYGLRCRHVR